MVGIKTAFKFQFCAACTRFRRVRSIPTKLEVLSRMSFDAIVQVAYCNTVYSLRIRRTLVRPPSPSSWSWMDVCSSQSNVPDWPCVSNRETPSAAFSWGVFLPKGGSECRVPPPHWLLFDDCFGSYACTLIPSQPQVACKILGYMLTDGGEWVYWASKTSGSIGRAYE